MSSRNSFSIKEVQTLVGKSGTLIPDVPDFHNYGGHGLTEADLSPRSKRLIEAFKPMLDSVDWSGGEGHDPRYAKAAETAKKVLAAHAMLNRLRPGVNKLRQEATTAGVDLPTFTRQLLMTITRAYAALFTPELFGVVPLTQPTGRINFKDFVYDSTYTGSTPNTSGGVDRTDDITKFNPNYYKAPEGVNANRIAFKYSNLDISVTDYRVIAEWSDSFADDDAAVYGDDSEMTHMNHMAQEMARVVDRSMIAAAISAVPSANQYDWTAVPTANPNYVALDPGNQQKYDERLWSVGVQTAINQIRTTRKYNGDGDPDWAVVGTNFALAMSKLSFFIPFEANMKEFAPQVGALRDLGTLRSSNIRFLVDPMLATTVSIVTSGSDSTGASHCYLGRRPRDKNDVGVKWCPYINLQPTRDLYDPATGMTTKGTRSRFAIAQPNTGVNAASSQLGEIYGRLRIQ